MKKLKITIEAEPFEFWSTFSAMGRGFAEVLTKEAAAAVEKQQKRRRR